jgi:transcriptional regulator with XRE-family HTH domain
VKELLVLLGKRVHELRAAKKWSQEEFAHVSGLHRTYIGQIERGEKNISFGNLVKVAAVLGVTASELLSALDGSGGSSTESKRTPPGRRAIAQADRQGHEIQKLLDRFRHQRAAMDQTMTALEDLMMPRPAARTPAGVETQKRRAKTR